MSTSVPPPPTTTTAKKILTTQETADLVGVTPTTLRAWRNDPASTFPKPFRLTSHSHRYDVEEVLAWIRTRRWLDRLAQGEQGASEDTVQSGVVE
jgi:predicted DNA-binding transcriptional regulator AlpA